MTGLNPINVDAAKKQRKEKKLVSKQSYRTQSAQDAILVMPTDQDELDDENEKWRKSSD